MEAPRSLPWPVAILVGSACCVMGTLVLQQDRELVSMFVVMCLSVWLFIRKDRQIDRLEPVPIGT